MHQFSFDDLPEVDLALDATYKGGSFKDVRDDPLARLLPVGNQGGFRFKKLPSGAVGLVVLYSSGEERENGLTTWISRQVGSRTSVITGLPVKTFMARVGEATESSERRSMRLMAIDR